MNLLGATGMQGLQQMGLLAQKKPGFLGQLGQFGQKALDSGMLGDIGMGLLSSNTLSRTPQNPMQHIMGMRQQRLGNEAQQAQMQAYQQQMQMQQAQQQQAEMRRRQQEAAVAEIVKRDPSLASIAQLLGPEAFASTFGQSMLSGMQGPEWSEPYTIDVDGKNLLVKRNNSTGEVQAIGSGPAVNVNVGEGANKPLSASELMNYIGADGSRPPVGSTMADLQTGGYKIRSSGEQKTDLSARGADATIDRLQELTDAVFEGNQTGIFNRLADFGKNTWGRLSGKDKELMLYEAFAGGTLAPLIRSMGEAGALANQDIERAIKLIPKTTGLPDPEIVAQGKLKQLREWFDTAQGRIQTLNTSGGTGGWSIELIQ